MEKSGVVRRGIIVAWGLAALFLLSACGISEIMDPTERSPRPDPAVESGRVENPVQVRDEEPPEATSPEESRTASESGEPEPPETTSAGSPSDPGESEGEGANGEGGEGVSSAGSGGFESPGDGVREVGDAGEVEFRVENGVLNLVNVSANSGWSYQLGKQDFDEVKVFFTGDGSRWEFEANLDDGYLLEIETKKEIPFADPGTYDLGEAGTVTLSEADGGIALDDYSVSEGWSAYVEEDDSEDVHLSFYAENGSEYEFEAEYDDGVIEVEIEGKERGSLASG